MEDVLWVNSIVFEEKVVKSREFMRRVVNKYLDFLKVVVFLGGKDSLVVFGLVLEEFGIDFMVFFNNMGIEFFEMV